MKIIKCFVVLLLFASCNTDDVKDENSLSDYLENRTVENGAVIACAGSMEDNTNSVEIFFYPESGASNFGLFETSSSAVDPNDILNYNRIVLDDIAVFNGYLRKFEGHFNEERWFIVSFELDGEIKLSNPIRIKHITQPTLYATQISINQDTSLMPLFTWNVNSEENNAIFFEVLSTIDNDLWSGTYTFETQFQYYNTANVVLNITNGTPPDLVLGETYKMTIMDVSEDNWINEIFVSQFTAQ
ncbi:hypothetical protein HNV08_04365 [Winogradskyella eckloniae]|uniref:hypothetical protein n=1 Tax=Winogradskyella eckloniae TaxID=1089306 RepID=UPI00156720E9|nr:hypothetical protein [Winogradskyella eckloniae]NRD19272.1 hypothetical protein [Winogradskyella eckloniae]